MDEKKMVHEKEQESLWEKVSNKCLERALTLLNEETAPDVEKAKAVEMLVETAISIDVLNLRWGGANPTRQVGFSGLAFGMDNKRKLSWLNWRER